jgi:hypothetical protein
MMKKMTRKMKSPKERARPERKRNNIHQSGREPGIIARFFYLNTKHEPEIIHNHKCHIR